MYFRDEESNPNERRPATLSNLYQSPLGVDTSVYFCLGRCPGDNCTRLPCLHAQILYSCRTCLLINQILRVLPHWIVWIAWIAWIVRRNEYWPANPSDFASSAEIQPLQKYHWSSLTWPDSDAAFKTAYALLIDMFRYIQICLDVICFFPGLSCDLLVATRSSPPVGWDT